MMGGKGPDERSSECPAHAAQSSRTGAAGGGRGTDADGRRGRFRRHRQNGAQMGGGLPDRRRQRPAGSPLPAPSPAQAHAGSHGRDHRSPAPPALDGPAHRSRGRRLAGHDQPHPPAPRPQSHPGARTRPAGPVPRYEPEHPGELIHIDIKKLGRVDRVGHRITGDRTGQSKRRGVGWEFVHVCIDDASRVAFSQILPNEKKESAVAFLKATVAYYANLGVTITRVMTDNGSCYRSKAFRCACRDLGLKHIRTKPYTPKTNGKAERFIQTALREWAYAQAYPTSDHRAAALPIWLHRYNWHRPHSSLKSKSPITRLALTEDNLLRLHT